MHSTIPPRTARVLAVVLGTVYGALALGYAYGPWSPSLASNIVTTAIALAALVCAVIGGVVSQRDPQSRPRPAFRFAARAVCWVSFGFFQLALFLLALAGQHASAETFNALSITLSVSTVFAVLGGYGVAEVRPHNLCGPSSSDSTASDASWGRVGVDRNH